MPSPRWRFKEKQRNDYHQEPANTEFFSQQDVADRLVRESGQNTIDATLEGQHARLVFSLTEAPAAAWRGFFATLWPHLEAQPELREKLPDPAAPIPCLVVEDFGTTGLTGPLEPEDPEAAKLDEKNHRFFWFFKNVGRTSKTGRQLGSFGIGKTVFPYSSRINTFFGFSVRRPRPGEPPMVLLGQSQLKEHALTGHKRPFDPFGFFAWQDGDEATYEQREICELAILEHFRALFGLTRTSDQTGLSVVIPYPANGSGRKDLAKAALVQFFLPILSGQLTVEIKHAKEHVELSAANLLEAIDRFEWQEGEAEPLKRRVRLAKWALGEGRAKLVDLARPTSSTTPKFEDTMVPAEQRRALSQNFIAGQRLAFRVPTPVEPKGRDAFWSHVEAYLEYERNSSTKEDLYAL
jgi:hypothetical protein